MREWLVVRQDDNGNTYVVATYRSEAEARRAARIFEERGHKQLYFVVDRENSYEL